MRKLEDLLKALLKNGLKISPKKCQFFRKELQYMGNTIFFQEIRVCVEPLHSRLEAIQKLRLPTPVKGCRSFVGMVNFLSIFCQDLQRLLEPIYDLTRKDRPFLWGPEQQMAFEGIKSRLKNHPYCIYLTTREGFTYIQIQVNILQAALYIRYKMGSLN